MTSLPHARLNESESPNRCPYEALPGVTLVLAALLGLLVQLAVAAPAQAREDDRSRHEARSSHAESGTSWHPRQRYERRVEPTFQPRTQDWRKPALRNDPALRPALQHPRSDRHHDHNRGWDRDRYDRGSTRDDHRYDHDRRSGFSVNLRFGNGIGHREAYRPNPHRLSCGCYRVCSCRSAVSSPRGRWEPRWCPPVYRTVRDRCGTVRRVCVSPGRYERVWVEVRVGGRF